MAEEIPLRITLVAPPAGVTFAVQLRRDGLLPPTVVAPGILSFDFTLQLVPQGPSDSPVLRGAAAQGPPSSRFVYIGVGQRAGDSTSCWDRRAKVPLGGISTEVLAAWRATRQAVLEAQIAAATSSGEPVCATVPLLNGGWQVRPAEG